MGSMNDTVRTANSLLRTLLFAALVVGAGFAGWQGYSFYNEPQKKLEEKERELDVVRQDLADRQQQVDTLSADLQAKTEQLEKTETSLRLLKLRHRIARLEVLDQQPIPDTDRVMTTVRSSMRSTVKVPRSTSVASSSRSKATASTWNA